MTVATYLGEGSLEIAFQDGTFECLKFVENSAWTPHIVHRMWLPSKEKYEKAFVSEFGGNYMNMA